MSRQPPAAAMGAVIREPSTVMGDFVLIRQCWTRRVLANIDEGKATGPDGIPGAILIRFIQGCRSAHIQRIDTTLGKD